MKTGMLATADVVETVARAISDHGFQHYVLDPVMVATSEDRLLDADAEAALASRLLPLATLVTPNLPEAASLTRMNVETIDDMRASSRRLVAMGANAALVKGGHLASDQSVDLYWDGADERIWRRDRNRDTARAWDGVHLVRGRDGRSGPGPRASGGGSPGRGLRRSRHRRRARPRTGPRPPQPFRRHTLPSLEGGERHGSAPGGRRVTPSLGDGARNAPEGDPSPRSLRRTAGCRRSVRTTDSITFPRPPPLVLPPP